MSRWLRRSILLFLFYLAATAMIAVVTMEGAFHPAHRPLTADDEKTMSQIVRGLDATLKDVSITTSDGAQLKAWNIQPAHANGNTVLLLHGLGDNRLGMTGYAELFLSHGYSVLMPDARAHGNSGGRIATYGFLEQNDIHQWFEWIIFNQNPKCVYGFGESMGAAQLLQSLQVEHHFCAVTAESPFSTFREIAYDRVGQFFKTGPWLGRTLFRPTVELAFLYARWRYKVDLSQVSPEQAVSTTKTPVLLIHGTVDRNIPARHSLIIAAANQKVVLWKVSNADHCGAFSTSPAEFETKVISWTTSHPEERFISSN
jgi:pimeloyl-ACP methyl ester carboxylesterase